METEITETRRIAYETWRFQVDSYWTRNSYFAAFEIAAVAGVWTVADKHPWIGVAFSALCLVLTFIWFFSDYRVHEYIGAYPVTAYRMRRFAKQNVAMRMPSPHLAGNGALVS